MPRFQSRLGGTLGVPLTLLLITACSDSAARGLAPADAARVEIAAPPPGRWTGTRVLAVDGTSLLARLDRPRGEGGAPTVVLMSGLDVPIGGWDLVQPFVARSAPAFAYDRAGVGGSGPISGARPSSVVAAELRAALDVAGMRPPFVLVAHSIAGLHARVFAARYPRDVAGLVFLDALHEDDLRAIPEWLIPIIASNQVYPGSAAEVLAQQESERQVRASGTLPAVPVAVITSMQGDPAARAIAWERQGEWARQGKVATHRASLAGHMLPIEAPGEVIEATRWVLQRAQRGR